MSDLLVPIVQPNGETTKQRKYVNTPFSVFYPKEQPIIIDWLYDDERKKPTARTVEQDRDCIAAPFTFRGETYHGHYGWGSSVKKGETFGLTHDIGWETGMMRYVEDGQRFQRWMMCQGWYGFDYRPMKIKFLPEKTMTKWGQVADGFGYFARPPLNNREPIKLGRSKGSYTFWQRIIMTPELWDELKPLIDARILNISASVATFLTSGHSLDYKAKLVDINPDMVEHPFVANVITDHWGEYLQRVATTAPIRSMYRLAVPADPSVEFVESGDPGGTQLIVDRFPIDSYGNVQAVESLYSERIANMECIQYSLSSQEMFAKGCGAVIDEPDLDGYDAILCNQDLKMFAGNIANQQILENDWSGKVVFAVTQRYARGTAIGVNVDWFKLTMGGDQDGDGVEVTIADGLPHLFAAVKALPYGESPKLPKVKRLLKQGDYRPEMIEQSMVNLVGFASNVTSQVLAKENQDDQSFLLGFSSAQEMHGRLNYGIKMGTDGFKTNIDPTPVVAMLTNIQAKLAVDEINPAPWCDWDTTDAFKWYVPGVYDKLYANDGKYFGVNDGVEYELDDEHFNTAVCRSYHDGCVGKIASYVLPQLVDLLGEGIKHQELTYFRHWSETDQSYVPYMKIIRNWWNINEHDVNWSDPNEVSKLKQGLTEKVNQVLERYHLDRWIAANTSWTIGHSARGLDNQAAWVFLAFPEECLSIVLLRPGDLPGKFETVLTGLDYQLPGFVNGVLECEIVDVDVVSHGRHQLRKALVSLVEGQKQPQSPYPENMVALVAINAAQPRIGKYQAEIVKTSDKAHRCLLSEPSV